MYLVYSVLFSLGIVLTAPYYLWRLRGKIFSAADWRERFGFLPTSFQHDGRPAIWIHAVSVGETLAVAGLTLELQQRYPEHKIFLSHVTPTGRGAGESRLPGISGRFYLPLDWGFCIRRAVERIRPAMLVIAETELWPNLLRAVHESGAKIILVNARLSDRSFRRYRWVGPFIRRVLENVDRICAQSPTDGERFASLGAKRERVVFAGNLKFDSVPPRAGEITHVLENALKLRQRCPILVAASTMPGEEALLLPAWKEIRRTHNRALFILAPRHPNRCEEVIHLLTQNNISLLRRTKLEFEEGKLDSAEVFLLDTIGELAGLFALADVVYIGGSLVPTGGHNVLEPAYWAKPIVFGPHMHNFRDIARQFVDGHAAMQVPDALALSKALLELLGDPERSRQLGEAAKNLLARESGATKRTLEHIAELLEPSVHTRARDEG
ncbi:MAG: 3-deoxy-D-manno-octulosonic acid transferase [Terriglobia bacterium]